MALLSRRNRLLNLLSNYIQNELKGDSKSDRTSTIRGLSAASSTFMEDGVDVEIERDVFLCCSELVVVDIEEVNFAIMELRRSSTSSPPSSHDDESEGTRYLLICLSFCNTAIRVDSFSFRRTFVKHGTHLTLIDSSRSPLTPCSSRATARLVAMQLDIGIKQLP